jgi:Flp pilus assembly protein TadG
MRRPRLLGNERGAELVEFALMAVPFFMIMFGTMEFGRMIWQNNVIANAAKDGARWAAVRGNDATTPASASDVRTYVQGRAFGLAPTVTTTWSPDNKAGSTVSVDVTLDFSPGVTLLPQATIHLRSKAQMLIAR